MQFWYWFYDLEKHGPRFFSNVFEAVFFYVDLLKHGPEPGFWCIRIRIQTQVFKGTIRPGLDQPWEYYHWVWIGVEKDINRYRFFKKFYFDLEYLIRVQRSGPLHTGTNRNLFHQTGLQKWAGESTIVLWITGRVEYLKNSNNQQSKPK
jgi:hypothetical protein